MQRRLPILLASAFLLLFVSARSTHLGRGWTWGHDQVGARYSTIARNFVRDGVLDPPLVQKAWSGRPPPAARDAILTTHPPGVPLLLAAGFALAGSSAPAVARAVMIVGALLTTVLLFLLVRRHAGNRPAAAAVLCLLAMPSAVYYGAWVDPVSWWSVAFVLAVVERWFAPGNETGDGWGRAVAIGGLWALAMVVEWNAIFLLPVLGADALATGWRRRLRTIGALAISTAAIAGLYRLALPSAAGPAEKIHKLARFHQWDDALFTAIGGYLRDLGSLPVLILALAGLAVVTGRTVRGRTTSLDRATVVLIAFQGAYSLAYPLGTRVHDFCLLYALVPIAMLAGPLFLRLHDAIRARTNRKLAGAIGLVALLAWGVISARAGLTRAATNAASAETVGLVARHVADTIAIDEIAATVYPREQVVPLAFHADRAIVGSITTPEALAALADQPWQPAVMIVPRSLMDSFQPLVEALERATPRRSRPPFYYYDLRSVDLERIADATRETGPTGPPPPVDVETALTSDGVVIRWTPAPGVPTRFRIAFGNAPGVYPALLEVDRPRFRYRTEASGPVHFVIRAIGGDGRLGPPTADQVVRLRGRHRLESILAAVAIAILAMTAMAGVVSARRRRV